MVQPSMPDIAKGLADAEVALDLVWTLLASFLVLFMQAGFALVTAGLTRAKNAAHSMGMALLVFAITVLGFAGVGFGLAMGGGAGAFGSQGLLNEEFTVSLFGKSFGLFGMAGFGLQPLSIYTAGVAATFVFSSLYMSTAASIPTGAATERWRITAAALFGLFMSTLLYPVYANWVWGGGWLSQLGRNFGLGHGHVDFAGSSVVHMTGGVAALIIARKLGPRLGKYSTDGRIHAIAPQSIPQVVLGTFILAFGWLGFNAGATHSALEPRIAVAAANTILAGAAGTVAAFLYVKAKWKKADPSWLASGMVAGLVAISASCAFVSAWAAVLTGAVGAILAISSASFIDARLRIDDAVGASAVPGDAGAWGVLALGLFANGTYGDGLNGVVHNVAGLFYGDGGQFVASVLGVVANVTYTALATMLYLWVIDRWVGNRVSAEQEVAGLDLPEMGVQAYSADPGPIGERNLG